MTVMRHRHEQGFAIPIAMGFGLMALLISVSMVVRSQADSTTAITQKAAARGLSAAETGIGRIQEKINLARVIAAYPACNSWSTGTSCNDTAGTSWKNSTAIPNLVTGCTGDPTASDISSIPDRAWIDVESGNAEKGQYRFIDYTYSAPQGTLTVEGRVNQSGSGSTATSGSRTSTSRLQVKIPVADASASASVPALWIGNGSATDMNNDKVNGNIVVNTCGLSSLTNPPTTANLTSSTTYSVKSVRRSFPGTPSLPSSFNDLTTGTLTPWISLPRSTDVTYTDSKGNVRYAYLVKDLVRNGSGSITLANSTVKVDLFVQGDIDLGGTPSINSSGSSSQMRIFGNELVSGSTYKYGCASGVTCPTSKVEFNGTGDINAFVYAPSGVGKVAGGGNTQGNIKGALWVKDWAYHSSNSKVKVDSVGNYGDYGFDNPLDRPTLSPITAWDRQEVSY
jgi:hypothetical protein